MARHSHKIRPLWLEVCELLSVLVLPWVVLALWVEFHP